MITDNFKISQVQGKWLVEWPGLGDLQAIDAKWRLLDMAFDTLGLYHVGIGYNLPYYGQKNEDWSVQWIDRMVWSAATVSNRYEYVKKVVFNDPSQYVTVNGIFVETSDAAEAMVNELEKRLTFVALKEEYATR